MTDKLPPHPEIAQLRLMLDDPDMGAYMPTEAVERMNEKLNEVEDELTTFHRSNAVLEHFLQALEDHGVLSREQRLTLQNEETSPGDGRLFAAALIKQSRGAGPTNLYAVAKDREISKLHSIIEAVRGFIDRFVEHGIVTEEERVLLAGSPEEGRRIASEAIRREYKKAAQELVAVPEGRQ